MACAGYGETGFVNCGQRHRCALGRIEEKKAFVLEMA